MTVAELIEKLREMPQEMEVYCSGDCYVWTPWPTIEDIAKNKGDSWDVNNVFQTCYPSPEYTDLKKAVIL